MAAASASPTAGVTVTFSQGRATETGNDEDEKDLKFDKLPAMSASSRSRGLWYTFSRLLASAACSFFGVLRPA